MTLKTVLSMLSAITSDAALAKMFEDTPLENICVIGVGPMHTGAMINQSMEAEAALSAAEPLLRYASMKLKECGCRHCELNLKGVESAVDTLHNLFSIKQSNLH